MSKAEKTGSNERRGPLRQFAELALAVGAIVLGAELLGNFFGGHSGR
jgi:hypothetical protein